MRERGGGKRLATERSSYKALKDDGRRGRGRWGWGYKEAGAGGLGGGGGGVADGGEYGLSS